MKKIILFCFMALLLNACKKIENQVTQKKDISAIKISNISNTEKVRLVNIIDEQKKLNDKDKLWLKEHLIKYKDYVYAFDGKALDILRKMTPQENLLLDETMNPKMRFIIFENGKTIAMSPQSSERPIIIRKEWDMYRCGLNDCCSCTGCICIIWGDSNT